MLVFFIKNRLSDYLILRTLSKIIRIIWRCAVHRKRSSPEGVAENVERAPHAFFAMVRFDNFLEPVFWVLQRNR